MLVYRASWPNSLWFCHLIVAGMQSSCQSMCCKIAVDIAASQLRGLLLQSQISQSFVGMTGAGWIALTGDLPATVEALKHTSPALLYPIKAAVAFPLVYHYLGGLRHVFWDKATYGNQVQQHLCHYWRKQQTCEGLFIMKASGCELMSPR